MTDNRPRLGGYLLIDRFAVGGAAEIYRGYDEARGEIVAIKRLRPDIPFDPEMTSGFLREVQLALLSKHPNLIRGFAAGTFGGEDYVVLEYVEGHDLSDLVERARDRNVKVPLTFWLNIIHQMLEGLAFAHDLVDNQGRALGLVHRDLNPRNVMIDYMGNVKLADFGAAVLKAHRKGAIRALPRGLDESVRIIIEIACSKDPDDRYKSARVMRDAVARVHPAVRWDDTKMGIATVMQKLFAKEKADRALNKVA